MTTVRPLTGAGASRPVRGRSRSARSPDGSSAASSSRRTSPWAIGGRSSRSTSRSRRSPSCVRGATCRPTLRVDRDPWTSPASRPAARPRDVVLGVRVGAP